MTDPTDTSGPGVYAVGVDLGGTNLKVALVERTLGILQRSSVETAAEDGPERVLDQMADGIRAVVASLPDGETLAGIGVGVPGAVTLDRTTVRKPPNLPGWSEVHVANALVLRLLDVPLGGPVLVENDANVAGLGSAFYGAGKAFGTFVMVTLGTGVGGAILVDGRLFRGATGAAGEIGHVSIDYEGPLSRGGVAGAVEAYLGQRFLSRHARYQLMNRTTALHATWGDDLLDITPHALHAAAEAGDAAARDVLAWAGHKLGVALGSVVNLLDIRKIVVGGGVSAADTFLLDPAREALARFVMPAARDGLELVRETRGNDVALLGAARLAFEHSEDRAV